MSSLGTFGAFDSVEAELVDDEQVGAFIAAELLRKSFVGERSGKIGDELGGGSVKGTKAQGASPDADGLHDVRFAHAGLTDENQVSVSANEIAGGELFDLKFVESFWIELPVESLESFSFLESGLADASLSGAFTALVDLVSDEIFEKIKVRECFVVSFFEGLVELS